MHGAAHRERIEEGLARLGHRGEASIPAWEEVLSGLEDGIVRVRVLADPGLLLWLWEPWAAPPQPYRLRPMLHPLGDLRGHPWARHKGLLGGWGEAALHQAQRSGAEDALCLWPDGTLAETAIAAVALRDGAILRCPPPEGRVASIAEAAFLPEWARRRGLALERGPVTLAEAAAQGLLCFNAARGLWQAEVLPSAPS